MAKLRRTIGRPAPAKKAAAKPATKAKLAAKAVKKTPAAKPRSAPRLKARVKPVARRAVHPSSRHKQKPGAAKPTLGRARPAKMVTPPKPPARSTYAQAVLTYERAMQALQAKRYRDAAHLLKTVITTYPEEKELLERGQLYLRVCERHLAPLDATPSTPEERVYAATLAINAGDTERAVALLTSALAQDSANDHAEYMLGVALAIRGNHEAAITHLERAVALNPETRNLIIKEADLEALRHTAAIVALLSAPPPPVQPRKDKDRRPTRRARGAAR
ncbi:MAG: tetratricopeptide repeat protein [Acidobacteria bacterium]|nr:tetratricopeptide repeat protein [Acidobacteriota bacterium]